MRHCIHTQMCVYIHEWCPCCWFNPTQLVTPQLAIKCLCWSFICFGIGNSVMGMGWVLRNDEGRFIGAKGTRILGNFRLNEAEAASIQEALSWIKGMGVGDVDIEIDSQLVFYALSSNSFNSSFDFIIDDVKEIASFINGEVFLFARRSANRVVHAVARKAVSMIDCNIGWTLHLCFVWTIFLLI